MNSSALCRAQEALHLRRAEESSLSNVKSVALSAAAAWGAEAALAEQREKRHGRTAPAANAMEDDAERAEA